MFKAWGGTLAIEMWAMNAGSNNPLNPWDELEEIAGVALDRDRLELERRARRDALLTVRHGVREFLDRCRRESIILGVVSNSPMHWIERQMRRLALDPSVFDLILSGEGHPPKPAPAGYLKALSSLGATTKTAVAFEDSERGVAAVKAAGLRCIAVPNEVTQHTDLSAADDIVSSLSLVTVRGLRES
jgi:HAD superfamily hydrolase (TIGR01509 family)